MRIRCLISAASIVLLSLVWPLAEHLTAHPDRGLAFMLALAGIAGFVAAGSHRPCPSGRSLARAAALAGLVLLVGAASTPILKQVAWRLHEVHLPLAKAWALHLPGPLALIPALFQGKLAVWTGEHTETVQLTCEALGLHVAWYVVMAVGVLSLLQLRHQSWAQSLGTTAGSVASIVIYAVFRFGVLTVLAVEFDRPGLLWQHGYTVASWLPLALVLRRPGARDCLQMTAVHVAGRPASLEGVDSVAARTPVASAPKRGRPQPAGADTMPRRRTRLGHLARYAPLVLAGLSLGFAAAFNDPGHVKQGRVIIDETHSDWEWTEQRFDTTAFGIRAEYNYYCFREYLNHFYEVTTINADLSQPPCAIPGPTPGSAPGLAPESTLESVLDSVLSAADVLVIKTPTRPYTDREVDVIVSFVERGGGLLLVGDHTNLFGMSTYLNSIASRFGMRFRFDDTFDLETTAFSTFRRSRVWFHPALRRVPAFEFLTSCSIEGGPGTEAVMVGCGLGSEEVDYGHLNFFGNIAFDLSDRFGLFLQAAAKRFGKGRVLLFTDSTCFSNFCMFSPGKPEAASGFIDYLNRCGKRYPHLRLGGLLLSCAVIGLSVATGRRCRMGRGAGARRQVAGIMLAVGSTFILGVAATSRVNAWQYGPTETTTPLATILFETGHCDASFFDYMGISALGGRQRFEELYMSAQRLGLHPRAGSVGDLAELSPLSVVVVNPVHEFSSDEIAGIERFVSADGALIVMDEGGAGRSTTNQVLRPFGLEVRAVPLMATPVSAGDNQIAEPIHTDFYPTLKLFGVGVSAAGNPPLPNVFTKDFGKGRVVVCLNSYRYSESVVGRPLLRTRPTPEIAGIYREIFAILRFGDSTLVAGLID